MPSVVPKDTNTVTFTVRVTVTYNTFEGTLALALTHHVIGNCKWVSRSLPSLGPVELAGVATGHSTPVLPSNDYAPGATPGTTVGTTAPTLSDEPSFVVEEHGKYYYITHGPAVGTVATVSNSSTPRQ